MRKVVKTYVWMLLPSFLTISLLWYKIVLGRLYVCTDPIPVFDWLPDHVHCAPENYYVREGDYYIAPKWVVGTLWWLSVGSIFVLAGVATYLLRGKQVRARALTRS